ncbi:hypothetical protein BS47DRAFT_1336297 [Hydnum rufescens UP504]|uniref:Major facilitator superfamily (MFS) profile domain-containing protein n=1 Tax=Hydnum rufescens UP504 TaxID=1448309 RepID=A0A9P6B924_9AGAM|nr:hypothetical protein BS47DRAFT_1336297 [Hydnum rufescens UP504]
MDSISVVPTRVSDLEDSPHRETPVLVIRRPSFDGTISDADDLKEDPGPRRSVVTIVGRDEAYLVGWDGPDDMENPKNWSKGLRWYISALMGLLVGNATFGSSAPSGIIPQMQEYFGFSSEVATLTVSLFVAGYCVYGPLLWGPLSETYGRRPIFIISFFLATIFQMACALSTNTASILIFRFLGGCFSASPLANSGAVISDVWDARTRGSAMTIFTLGPFAGPALGPAVGGFIGVSGASWRWLYWILTIISGVHFVLVIFTLPETYAPTILKQKAQRRRKETGNDQWYAPLEAVKVTLRERYLLFEAYPIVFEEGHHLNAGIAGLMFLPLLVGCALGCVVTIVYFNPQYNKLADLYAPHHVPPEVRLHLCILGGPLFVISLFWFGWTSYPGISYWSPMLAGGMFGMGWQLIFLSLVNYVVEVYLSVAASALAVTVIVRSAFGAGFPLFARQMYEKLNPRWASTVLAFISLVLVPIPILFVRYGPYLRTKSKNMPAASRETAVLPSKQTQTLPKEGKEEEEEEESEPSAYPSAYPSSRQLSAPQPV